MLKIWFLRITLKTLEMWSNGIKISIYFQKNTKSCPAVGSFAPTPPSEIRLCYTRLLTMSPNLDILTFICFKLSPFSKILVACQTRPRLLIFHFAISLSRKKCLISKMFEDVIACSGGSRKFWWGRIIKILSTKPQKFGNSNVFSAQNQVVSKKKKRSSPKLRLIFRPKSLGLGWWGDASPPSPA